MTGSGGWQLIYLRGSFSWVTSLTNNGHDHIWSMKSFGCTWFNWPNMVMSECLNSQGLVNIWTKTFSSFLLGTETYLQERDRLCRHLLFVHNYGKKDSLSKLVWRKPVYGLNSGASFSAGHIDLPQVNLLKEECLQQPTECKHCMFTALLKLPHVWCG